MLAEELLLGPVQPALRFVLNHCFGGGNLLIRFAKGEGSLRVAFRGFLGCGKKLVATVAKRHEICFGLVPVSDHLKTYFLNAGPTGIGA